MPFSDEFLAKWEHLIDEVTKTQIPLECIKKVVIRQKGGKQKTINLQTLRRQGLDSEELEIVVGRTLSDIEADLHTVNFIVDAAAVAEIVQPETDKILIKLK
jgi:hypothetical protein